MRQCEGPESSIKNVLVPHGNENMKKKIKNKIKIKKAAKNSVGFDCKVYLR